ncbi:MAG: hypothetical protein PHD51_04645 [Patescibacteria group bacterium]|nr:hypothetical protein [Patescibacteria group bacterium]MDD5490785.1 hypothetical protein [Patescibacteria group bacterium]
MEEEEKNKKCCHTEGKRSKIKELWEAIKQSFWNADNWLFWLNTLWAFALLTMCYIVYFAPDFSKIPPNMLVIYYSLLILYTSNKELVGWTSSTGEAKLKPGEFFIGIWILTAFIMLIGQFATNEMLIMPEEILTILGWVGTIFFGREASKRLRKWRGDVKAEKIASKKDS